MAPALLALSIDCADAERLAGSWAEALRRPVNPGATVLRVFEENGRHRRTTFANPEGTEFDLVTG